MRIGARCVAVARGLPLAAPPRRRLCAAPRNSTARGSTSKEPPPPPPSGPSIPDATTLFKMVRGPHAPRHGTARACVRASRGLTRRERVCDRAQSNPELMLDPQKAVSWKIVGGVVAFFAIYLSVTAYREGLFDPVPAKPEAPAELALDIQKARARAPRPDLPGAAPRNVLLSNSPTHQLNPCICGRCCPTAVRC
jgi:hypothetical protein